MARKSKGRQRVPMEKMQNHGNLMVTFSKRRSGLFKKASELSTLCGSDIGIVVFSPGQNVYSFGHPSIGSIIDRYRNGNPPPEDPQERYIVAQRETNLRELNAQLTNANNMLEYAKTQGEVLEGIRRARRQELWEHLANRMNMEELLQVKEGLEGYSMTFYNQAHKLMLEGAAPAQHHASSSVAAFHPPTSGLNASSGPFDAKIPGYHVFDSRSPVFSTSGANNFEFTSGAPVFHPIFQNFGDAGSVPLSNLRTNLGFTGFDPVKPSSFTGGQVLFEFNGDIPYEDQRGSAPRFDNEARASGSNGTRDKGKGKTPVFKEFDSDGHRKRFFF